MVEVYLITIEPNTGNVTKTLLTLALNFSLIDGPFGLRELESDSLSLQAAGIYR